LVDRVLASAKAHGLEWLVLSEHGPWLGVNGVSSITRYNEKAGEQSWNYIRDAADELAPSPDYQIHVLMGEEIGSAPPYSVSGHFNVYQTDQYIPNDIDALPDAKYIADVEKAGAWGAINHPFHEGNGWDCWDSGSTWSSVSVPDPLHLLQKDCPDNAEAHAPKSFGTSGSQGFRAMEITSGGRFPPTGTLEEWDRLLSHGLAIAAVGGSDAHTLSRSAENWESGVHGRLGGERLVGRSSTYVYSPRFPPPDMPYDSRDPNDPVRLAILSGATVASNGAFASAQVAGEPPGSELAIDPTATTLNVTVQWQDSFTPTGNGPDVIRVVAGQEGPECAEALCSQVSATGCVVTSCGEGIVQQLSTAPYEDSEHHQTSISIVVPAEWMHFYLRVEVLEFEGSVARYGAFTSPFFISRT
jgi:hypothetical protein